MRERPIELDTSDGCDKLRLYQATVTVSLYAADPDAAERRVRQVIGHSLEDIEVIRFVEPPRSAVAADVGS